MALLRMIHPIHTWHDALIFIAMLGVLYVLRVFVILAKRITFISLPKREVRFERKQ